MVKCKQWPLASAYGNGSRIADRGFHPASPLPCVTACCAYAQYSPLEKGDRGLFDATMRAWVFVHFRRYSDTMPIGQLRVAAE